MNATQLMAHFDRLAEAPNAVPRLRRFILDLAVRGKLVEQDVKDEPAAELLKRIQVERMKLIKAGKFREGRAPTNILGDLPTNQLPVNWSWVPFGATVNTHLGGGTPSKANSTYWNGEILWASVKDVGKTKYLDSTIDRITEAGLADSSSNLIEPGNLIVVTRMGLGKVSINRVPVAINQDLRAFSLSSLMSIDYCYIYFKTHGFEGSGLTVKGIKIEELLGITFPLPPLAEQHRIVAKVDELMALCDQLEASQQEREHRRDRLADASLQRLNQPTADSNPEAQREHARFHLQHLSRLTTRPEHIKAMRQAIFNFAVRGWLLPQNCRDENAAALFADIQIEKTRLIREAVIKPYKQHAPLNAEDIPYILPAPWIWTRLSDLADVQDPNPSHRMPLYVPSGGEPFISSENFASDDQIDFTVGKQVDRKTLDEQIARFPILPGAFGFTRIGTIGKSRLLPLKRTYAISHAVCVVNPIDSRSLSMRFLRLTMSSEVILGAAHKGVRSVGVPDLGMAVIRAMPIPLPPLTEQHRIVAKVDELMALCDQLEAQLASVQTDSRRLLEAVLEVALAPA